MKELLEKLINFFKQSQTYSFDDFIKIPILP